MRRTWKKVRVLGIRWTKKVYLFQQNYFFSWKKTFLRVLAKSSLISLPGVNNQRRSECEIAFLFQTNKIVLRNTVWLAPWLWLWSLFLRDPARIKDSTCHLTFMASRRVVAVESTAIASLGDLLLGAVPSNRMATNQKLTCPKCSLFRQLCKPNKEA